MDGKLGALRYETYFKLVAHESTAYSSDGKLTYITTFDSEKRLGGFIADLNLPYGCITVHELPNSAPIDITKYLLYGKNSETLSYVTDKNGKNYFISFKQDSKD